MKHLLSAFLLLIALNSVAQDWPVRQKVLDAKARQVVFTSYAPFTVGATKRLGQRGTYYEMRINTAFTSEVMRQRPAAISLSIPVTRSQNITCELVKFDLGTIKYTENNTRTINDVKIPVLYRGVVNTEQGKNNVMLTVTEDYLSLTVITNNKMLQLVKTGLDNDGIYRLYNSESVNFPQSDFECGMKDNGAGQTPSGIMLNGQARPATSADKCVYVFVDCFDSLYIFHGRSKQATIDYVHELYNTVSTGYLNENVNLFITEINVWTTPDPYRVTSRDTALADLGRYRRDSFWGNICAGLDYSVSGSSRGGLAGGIGRVKGVAPDICPAFISGKDNPCFYNDLDYNVVVQDFPVGSGVTQQQAYSVMHETGHLLGVHHTKWCGWKLSSSPDVYGAIDSCGPHDEGACIVGPPPPANGATIMSYCVLSNMNGLFVSFNNGFGTLPGNALRNFVDQTVCIPTCIVCTGLLLPQRDSENKKHPDKNLSQLFMKQNDEHDVLSPQSSHPFIQ